MEDNYDIISVGLYERSWPEIRDALRSLGVSTVIDTRSTRTDRNNPAMSGRSTERTVRDGGFRYVHLGALDGRTKDPRAHLSSDIAKPADYARVMEMQSFQDDAKRLCEEAKEGRTAIIFSGRSARNGAAAKLIGQYIEKNTGLRMGHVMDIRDGSPRLSSQEEVIEASLGAGLSIREGSYKDISFTSDGHWSAGEDVKIGRVVREDRTIADRTIEGRWNYGSEGEIVSTGEDRVGTAMTNGRWADCTIAISNTFTTEEARIQKAAADGRYIRARIPNRREEFLGEDGEIDTALVERVAGHIRREITKQVTGDILGGKDADETSLKVNIVGANIARLANQYREAAVTETEISRTTAEKLRSTDTHEAVAEGPDQELINRFMSMVMAQVRQGTTPDGENTTYRIAQVRTDGESGIAEAAVMACQEQGIPWSISAPKGFPWTKDDETVHGQTVSDQPSFENRFRQGLTAHPDRETLVEDARRQSYIRSMEEVSIEPGLKDNQVALLQQLGFDNNDITTMIDVARSNGVVIMDDDQMQEFIESCGGYGVSGAALVNTASVTNAREELENLLERCSQEGISFITAANPSYPKRLAAMEPYSERSTDTVMRVHDGSVSFETVDVDRQHSRPAILWYKGNLGIADGDTCTVLGTEASTDPYELLYGEAASTPERSQTLAREIGRKAAEAGITPVVNLQDGIEMTAADEAMRYGGAPVVVSSEPIDSPRLSDYSDRVVRSGGVVMSEQAPMRGRGLSTGESQSRTRAQRMAAGIGKAGIIVNGMASGKDLSLADCALFWTLASAVVIHHTNGHIYDRFKAKFARNESVTVMDGTGEEIDGFLGKVKGEKKQEKAGERQEHRTDTRERMPVEVLRMEGKQPVFLVPSSRPDIRQAIMKECGTAVQFESPSRKEALMSAMLGYPDGVSWSRGRGPWYEDEAACLQKPMVCEDVVFYDKGRIHTLASAPDSFPGLKSQKIRRESIARFEEFRMKAEDLREKMQTSLDMPGSAPIYLRDARYLSILPNSVEIREGSELRARVYLSSAGVIRVENIRPLSADLEEHGERQLPLLQGRLDGSAAMLDQMLFQMEEALMGRGTGESDSLALATREEQEELLQQRETGFMKEATDNSDTAALDISEAIRDGVLADVRAFGEADPLLLYHNAGAAISEYSSLRALAQEQRSRCYRDYEERSAALSSLALSLSDVIGRSTDIPDAMREKVSEFIEMAHDEVSSDTLAQMLGEIRVMGESSSDEDRIMDICSALGDAVASCQEKLGEIQELSSQIRTLSRDISSMEACRLALAKGETVRIAARPGDDLPSRYLIGRHMYDVSGADDGTVDREAVTREIAEQRQSGRRATFRAEATETKAAGRGTAREDEVVSPLSNGLCIIERDGMQAYANDRLEIMSDFYARVAPFGQNCGKVTREDGKVNLLSPEGNEKLAIWADAIGSVHEGFAQVQVGGTKNLVSTSTFEMASERWYPRVDIMSNGWALVCNDRGLYNYVDSEGMLISCDQWFTRATRFSGGFATVSFPDGSSYRIDTHGEGQAVGLERSQTEEQTHGHSRGMHM